MKTNDFAEALSLFPTFFPNWDKLTERKIVIQAAILCALIFYQNLGFSIFSLRKLPSVNQTINITMEPHMEMALHGRAHLRPQGNLFV